MSKMAPAIALLVCFATIGCDDNPTSPDDDDDFTLTAQLSPANEVPPVTNADASGSGTVTIELDVTRNSAGTITAATADFDVSLSGFVPGTSVSMAHIHSGAAGVNGPVEVDTGVTVGQVVLANGTGTFSRDGVTVTPEDAQNLVTGTSGFYFNVHTVLTPSGAVRGQLVR